MNNETHFRSLAAGLGNLHHQTYTKVMEDAVQEVFASVGIEFLARNHAIKEKQSAPETGLCAEAIGGRTAGVRRVSASRQEHR